MVGFTALSPACRHPFANEDNTNRKRKPYDNVLCTIPYPSVSSTPNVFQIYQLPRNKQRDMSTMPEESISDFSLPWCKALLADSSLEPVPTFSRVRHHGSTENSLLAISLRTPNTIRACMCLIERPADSRTLGTSIHMLFSLGSGVNGISGVCHGSIVTLMFDEAFGQLMTTFLDRDWLITAELAVSFKRPLRTPAVVLCTTWIETEPEGRKTWMRGKLEDGLGGVYAEGRALYLKRKEKGSL